MVAVSIVFLLMSILSTFFLNAQSKLPGMLYPRDSESRSLRRLDGMWNFRIDNSPARNESFVNQWFADWLYKVSVLRHTLRGKFYLIEWIDYPCR